MGINQPSLDQFLKLLANRRCRYVLYCLDEADDSIVAFDDLVDQVLQRERELDNHEYTTTAAHRENVEIGLHHDHLPRLSDAGVIDYDIRTQVIRNGKDQSLVAWVQNDLDELPYLRALLTTSEA